MVVVVPLPANGVIEDSVHNVPHFALLPLKSASERSHSSTATALTSFSRWLPQRGKIHFLKYP